MPLFNTVKDVLAYRDALKGSGYTRIPQFRAVIDRKMENLIALREVMAPDYKKAFIPYQSGTPAKSMYRLTNIMASNASEIRYKARSTDPQKIAQVQRHEHGHEALDPLLFPIDVIRKMYSFLGDGYTVVAVDITPRPGTLTGYADRPRLQKYAEGADTSDEGDTPEASYKRAYGATSTDKTVTERHEAAYQAATDEALINDGAGIRVRVVDPLTFKGFQTDEEPCLFAEGMEYGRKQLNPLLKALGGFGVRKGADGCLYIEGPKGGKRTTMSYKALGVGTIADAQSSTGTKGEEYVEYTQIRTCEETVILIENPGSVKGENGETGILIKVPNLFGGESTGYYLIEGDAKLRSGDIEERYDPPMLNLINEAQHYNFARTIEAAMAGAEATRGLYQSLENQGAAAIEPHDPTQETKTATPQEGQPIPIAAGKVLRVEGFGQATEKYLEHAREMMKEAEPTDIWGGTGSSSETGIAIARRETALLTELAPYQANRAKTCKLIHMDVDRYVADSGIAVKLAYLPQGAGSGTKPEIREITPETAKLAMDMDYTIGADTPESKAASEQMSERRWTLGVIGISDHREEIGIKDPVEAENRMAEDRLVQMLLGTQQQPGIIDEAFRPAMLAYAKAALVRELGPLPEPPPVAQGQPPPAGGAAPVPGLPQPLQMNAQPAGVPVTAGAEGLPQ